MPAPPPPCTPTLQDLTYMLGYYNDMYGLWIWYGMLQSIVLCMLMMRLINLVAFQPRLSILSGSLAFFLTDFVHFLMVLVACIVMLAAICNVIYGYRVESVSGLDDAISTLLQYMFVGVNTVNADAFTLSSLIPRNLILSDVELALAEIILLLLPIFCLTVLAYFVTAMLLVPLTHLRRANCKKPGVITDLLSRCVVACVCACACACYPCYVSLMHPIRSSVPKPWAPSHTVAPCPLPPPRPPPPRLRWSYQRAWAKAPTNKHIDKELDWILLPPMNHSWWFHQIYSAVVRSTAAAQMRGDDRRRVAGKSHRVIELDLETVRHAHFNFKKLAREFDAMFLDNPDREEQAIQLILDTYKLYQGPWGRFEPLHQYLLGRRRMGLRALMPPGLRGSGTGSMMSGSDGGRAGTPMSGASTGVAQLLKTKSGRVLKAVSESADPARAASPATSSTLSNPVSRLLRGSGSGVWADRQVKLAEVLGGWGGKTGAGSGKKKNLDLEVAPDAAGIISKALMDRFGKSAIKPPPTTIDALMAQVRKRLETGRSDSSATSSDYMLPSGMRVGELKRAATGRRRPAGKRGHPQEQAALTPPQLPAPDDPAALAFGLATAATGAPMEGLGFAQPDDLALQRVIAAALRNVGHAAVGIADPHLQEDPELLATLFAAQFAGAVPVPNAAGGPRRPMRKGGAQRLRAGPGAPQEQQGEGEALAHALWQAATGEEMSFFKPGALTHPPPPLPKAGESTAARPRPTRRRQMAIHAALEPSPSSSTVAPAPPPPPAVAPPRVNTLVENAFPDAPHGAHSRRPSTTGPTHTGTDGEGSAPPFQITPMFAPTPAAARANELMQQALQMLQSGKLVPPELQKELDEAQAEALASMGAPAQPPAGWVHVPIPGTQPMPGMQPLPDMQPMPGTQLMPFMPMAGQAGQMPALQAPAAVATDAAGSAAGAGAGEGEMQVVVAHPPQGLPSVAAAAVQTLTSHAMHLTRELKAVQGDLDAMLRSTEAIIASILRHE